MKTALTLSLAAAGFLASLAGAQAQDRQVTVYSGPVGVELPASMLRGSTSSATAATADTAAPRKVRIIMASPYGN